MMGENFILQPPPWHQSLVASADNVGEVKKEPLVVPATDMNVKAETSQPGGRAPIFHTVGHSIFQENNIEEGYEAIRSRPIQERNTRRRLEVVGTSDTSRKPVEIRRNWKRVAAVEELIMKIGDIWQCKHCGKTGKTSGQIRMHAERHIEGLVFDCDLCGKSFRSRGTLAMHKWKSIEHRQKKGQRQDIRPTVISGPGPATDEVTKVAPATSVSSNLELREAVEQLVLKNGDLWQCKYCGKAWKHRSQVRMHCERHIEGLAFDCHICGKSFRSRGSLACHKSNKHRMRNEQNSSHKFINDVLQLHMSHYQQQETNNENVMRTDSAADSTESSPIETLESHPASENEMNQRSHKSINDVLQLHMSHFQHQETNNEALVASESNATNP